MTLTSIINTMTEVVTLAVPTLLVLLVFYWNISQIIFSADNPEKRKQAIPRLLWSIVALLVIFSLGGIINIISATLLGNGSGSNILPPASSQTTSGAPGTTGTAGTAGATGQAQTGTPFLPSSPSTGPGSQGITPRTNPTTPPRQSDPFNSGIQNI